MSGGTVAVDSVELRIAIEFVSSAAPSENNAYISLDTGKIYWTSDVADIEDEDQPEDLETSDRYIAVPHKNDLDLGRRLVMDFVEEAMPDATNTVAGFFRRKGAYGRFKDLLQTRGMLQRWYDFEDRATEDALRAWCDDSDIQPVGGR